MENKRSLLLQILTKIKYVKNTTPFERIFHCERYFCIFKQIFIYSTNLYCSCSERFGYLPRIFFVTFLFFRFRQHLADELLPIFIL